MTGETADCRRIRAAVVVDDDDQVWRLRVGDLVERLIGHAAGQRAVPNHSDHVSSLLLTQPGFGDPERVAERRGSVAVFDEVVFGLLARRVSGHTARLTQLSKVPSPTGD